MLLVDEQEENSPVEHGSDWRIYRQMRCYLCEETENCWAESELRKARKETGASFPKSMVNACSENP